MSTLWDLPHAEAVYAEFRQEAERLWDMGHRHFSADGVMHFVRGFHHIPGRDSSGYKCNNNDVADFARRLMAEDPARFGGFFETRRRRVEVGS